MNQYKGYYSLIQFCPDPSRLEGINIGVLVYSPESARLVFRLTQSNQRIRKVFGQQDWNFIDRVRESVQSRLRSEKFETVSDLEGYIAKRANVVQLTPVRPLKIGDIDQEISALYRRLVEPETVARKPRIATYLSKKLIEAGVQGLVKKSISIEIPTFRQPIRVPYGYQNGRFNLISPIQFNPDREDILTKAGKSAIEGQLLYQNPDPHLGDLRLVVIARFADRDELSSRKLVAKIFAEHQVSLHTFDNIEPLVEDIRKSARLHSN
jgi:Protein of unknown function (DUF3037)